MFAWRYNLYGYLEISPYSNIKGRHINSDNLENISSFKLYKAKLKDFTPIKYSISIEDSKYLFEINYIDESDEIVNYKAKLPRGCEKQIYLRKFAGFYFGGNKTSPHKMAGYYKDLVEKYQISFDSVINNLLSLIGLYE